MALKECKECGGQVSTKADVCPHCGAKKTKSRSRLLFRVWWLFPVAVVFAGFLFVRGVNSHAQGNVLLKAVEVGATVPLFTLKNVLIENQNWFSVKDAEITCIHRGENGEALEKSSRFLNAEKAGVVLSAGDTWRIPEVKFGVDIFSGIDGGIDIFPDRIFKGESVSCWISAVKVF